MTAAKQERKRRRWPRRFGYGILTLLFVLGLATWFTTDHLRGFGGAPDERELARFDRSSHFRDGHFENLEPTAIGVSGKVWAMLSRMFGGDEMRSPNCPLPLVTNAAERLRLPPPSGLRVTWLGHSTTLIELDGARILTDPIWSERSSPTTLVGPKRFHPPPLPLADLRPLDAVVVSHEHFDHLDMATIRALARTGVAFHVPLGVGSHLLAWGVAPAQIHEHDWWDSEFIAHNVQVISTPSRHFNGRGVPGRTGTSWTSWSLIGPAHRVFFSGDTGLTQSFRDIGERLGPFDVAMFEIGQSDPLWPDIHLGPVGALDAHAMLGARTFVPIHWATFQLGFHDWSEPAETLVQEAARRHVEVLTPRLGEPVEPTQHPRTEAWWRALPPTAPSCPR